MPLVVKQHIHAVNMFDNDSIMIYSTSIASFPNTLNNNHISAAVLNEPTYTYYYDKDDYF